MNGKEYIEKHKALELNDLRKMCVKESVEFKKSYSDVTESFECYTCLCYVARKKSDGVYQIWTNAGYKLMPNNFDTLTKALQVITLLAKFHPYLGITDEGTLDNNLVRVKPESFDRYDTERVIRKIEYAFY